MIEQNDQNNQLPKELKSVFYELEISKHLRNAGIKKKFGFSAFSLFQLVFCLIFQPKSWFSLLRSKKGNQYPDKDSIYRFMNHSKFAWRRFLTILSASTIQKVNVLTDSNRLKLLIIVDSMFERNRSKKVELLARCMNHSSLIKRFYKGFRMLTLGWSDGFTFMPIDFTLLSSKNSQINGISADIDKRSSGYKRRLEALESSPFVIPGIIERALKAGVPANYVLMDTWFTQQPLIQSIVVIGVDVIDMVKNTKQCYLVNGRRLSLKEPIFTPYPFKGKREFWLYSYHDGQRHTVKSCVCSKP